MENEKRGEHFSKGDINAYNPDILTGTAQIKKNQDMRIHPIFRPEKFDSILDYKTAFEEAALLASRLLHSKQSYHWLFALWFGDNKQSRVPYHFRNMSSPDVPEEYTVNRGIGELTRYEIDAVDQNWPPSPDAYVSMSLSRIPMTIAGTENVRQAERKGASELSRPRSRSRGNSTMQ